jgi:Cytochrome P460
MSTKRPIPMLLQAAYLLIGITALLVMSGFRNHEDAANSGPQYTSDGQLLFPKTYRSWIYLSSGFDMNYNPTAQPGGRHVFDNVFVNPEAYKKFLDTGAWPDYSVFVLEIRSAEAKGSINRGGSFQGSGRVGIEVHVKDSARFPGKWAFFDVSDGKAAKMIPQSAGCYSCHAEHGGVDTTFVQFYPTLLPIAKSKGTFSPAYLKEIGNEAK